MEEEQSLGEPGVGYTPITLDFADDDAQGEKGDERLYTKDEFARYVCERVTAGIVGRRTAGFDNRVRSWRNQYDGVTRPKMTPWPNSSNLHIHQSRSIADAIHAQMYKALFGVAPIFQGVARSPARTQQVHAKEKAMEYICRYVVKLPGIGDRLLHSALIDGTAIAMPYWKIKKAKKRRWLPDPQTGQNHFVESVEKVFDGPQVEVIDILDFGMYPSASKSIEDAQISFARRWRTKTEILAGVSEGAFDKDAAHKLVSDAPSGPGRFSEQSGGDEQRIDKLGIQKYSEIDDLDKPYETFDCLVQFDSDNDGMAELCLVTIELHTKCILRAERYPYLHDRPFFVAIRPLLRDNYFYGYSTMEILAGDQAELNAIHNQSIDNGTLRNSAVFVMKRSMKWNPSANPIRPGLVLPADNPSEDIKPLQFGSDDQRAYADEARVRQNMKESMGVNDAILAQPTNGEGTLGGLERALQSASVKSEVQEARVREALEEIGQQIAELIAQYQPDDLQVPVGEDEQGNTRYQAVTREDLQVEAEFRVRGTSALANPVIQAQKAEKLYMFAERNPIVQSDPANMYAVSQRVLQGWGFDDEESILGSKDKYLQFIQQQQAAPPPPPEVSYSAAMKPDEVTSLAMLMKNGQLSPEEYATAGALAAEIQKILLAAPSGAAVGDAADNGAGYEKKAAKSTSI